MRAINILTWAVICAIFISCSNKKPEIVEEFYGNGIIKSESEVKDGMRNGLTKNYDEQGRLVSTAEYVNDLYNGEMINYNPINGKVTAKALYKDDVQEGPAILNYATGELYREMYYKQGRIDSIVKTFWANGKQQAEVYFKMGAPAIGLKEWDDTGNQIKQPTLVIQQINQLSLLNKIVLKVSLSGPTKDVDYYVGELVDGKYLDSKSVKIKSKGNVAMLDYIVPRGHTLVKNVTIVARTRTQLGNTLLLSKNYFFSVKN